MNKNILITGSTDGIGKLAAQKLAMEGHHLYLHGRNASKLESVVTELKSVSNNSHIKGFVADFSELASISQMVKHIEKEISHLDVLINNAGVFKSSTTLNADGLDLRFVVNYVVPFKLTQELLPLLRKSNAPRLINLSSAAQSPVSLEALKGERSLNANEAYAQSKLALTMWSFNLALKEPELLVIAVNPGSLLNTKMVKEAYGQHWSSADKGANILFELASSDAYLNQSGKYFDNDKGSEIGHFSEAHPDAYDQEKQENLINTTSEIIESVNH